MNDDADDTPISPFGATELLHQRVMRTVVNQLQDTPYVLKGGTALLLAHGLDRHSTDLDFDSGQKVNIEGRIRAGLEEAGVETLAVTNAKDTGTVQRFKVHYQVQEGESQLLKIETSFRADPDAKETTIIDGIRTYTIGELTDQKLDAAENRLQARDFYDLAFIAKEHGDGLRDDQIQRMEALTSDLDAAQETYGQLIDDDPVLSAHTSGETVALAFRIDVEDQMARRGLSADAGDDPLAAAGIKTVGDAQAFAAAAIKEIEDRLSGMQGTEKEAFAAENAQLLQGLRGLLPAQERGAEIDSGEDAEARPAERGRAREDDDGLDL